MQTYIKRIIGIVLVLLPFCASSQTVKNFVFSYDASGNRIQRIIGLKSAQTTSITTIESSTVSPPIIDNTIEGMTLQIYPNPTKGLIKLDIKGLRDENVRLYVYSVQGSIIFNSLVNNGITNIDLSKQPPGLYLMKIILKNQISEWKIVKE
jgi:hypothetical protein